MSFNSAFELAPLVKIAKFINGDRSTNYPKSKDYVVDGIPFISAADLNDGFIETKNVKRISQTAYERLRSGKIKDKDILFCLRGSIGKLAYVKPSEIGAIASSLVIVRATEYIDARYLYFILRSQAGQQAATSLNNGSAQPNLSVGELQKIKVPLPSILIQREIAATLDFFDNRITLLRETNATLEAIAQALFKSWFVDFDPVRAKMEGRVPEAMDEATAEIFPDQMEESYLGLKPIGWAVCSFAQSLEIIGGGTPKTTESAYWGGDIPWFSVVDAPSQQDVFVLDTEKHITDLALKKSSTRLLPEGTTIISARGTVGRLALTGKPMAMNQSCYGLRGNAGDEFFTYFTTLKLVQALKQRTHGSVFDTITRDTFEGIDVVYPPASLIAAFEKVLSPLMARVKCNLNQIRVLSELRDALLPRLISGQLRIPEAMESQRAAA